MPVATLHSQHGLIRHSPDSRMTSGQGQQSGTVRTVPAKRSINTGADGSYGRRGAATQEALVPRADERDDVRMGEGQGSKFPKVDSVRFAEPFLAVPSKRHLRRQMGEGGTKKIPRRTFQAAVP